MATRLCLSHAQPLLPLPTGHLHVLPQETRGSHPPPPHTQPSAGGGQKETSPIKHSQLVSFKKVVSGCAVSQRIRPHCREQWAQSALDWGPLVPDSPLVALAPQCPAAPALGTTSPIPCISSTCSQLPPPELLFAWEASRFTFVRRTFLTNSTLQPCQGRNTHGSDFSPPPEGSKALRCHTGMERTGKTRDAHYKYKIISATNKGRILYIFDPYTQEHNIHRTPRRSGGFARSFQRSPCCPHAARGCADGTSERLITAMCIMQTTWVGWGPHRAHHTVSHPEEGKEEGEERAGASSSLMNPQGVRNEAGP